MKKLLSAALLLLVLAATAANVNLTWKRSSKAEEPTIVKDSVVIQGDTLMLDSLSLSLKKIPKAQHLYSVAKVSVGKWAKLFTVIKIEESGADGKNSYYARTYYNLTGMRWPGTGRKTTAIAKGNNHYAIFNHWHDCMLDWKIYIDVMESKFIAKNNRAPKDEYEMVDFMFGSYNPYQKWKNDMYWLLRHFRYQ
ncbi:MAG: hypothetical protein IT244_06690 [Bacteroidia bacterium]|nr:hypothetical protein [Bacteroidia bacterium]